MRTADDDKRSEARRARRPLLAFVAAIALTSALAPGCAMLDLGDEPGNVFDEMLDDGLDCLKNVDGLTWSADPHNMFDTPSVEAAVMPDGASGEGIEVHRRIDARRTDAVLVFSSTEHHPLADGGCVHIYRLANYDQEHAELILCWPEYSLVERCGAEDEVLRELAEAEAISMLEDAGGRVSVEGEPSLEAVSFFVEAFLEQVDRTSFTSDDWGAYERLVRSA